jgi:hypothetical protein
VTICSSVNRVFFIGSLGGPKAPFSQASAGPKIAEQITIAFAHRQDSDQPFQVEQMHLRGLDAISDGGDIH